MEEGLSDIAALKSRLQLLEAENAQLRYRTAHSEPESTSESVDEASAPSPLESHAIHIPLLALGKGLDEVYAQLTEPRQWSEAPSLNSEWTWQLAYLTGYQLATSKRFAFPALSETERLDDLAKIIANMQLGECQPVAEPLPEFNRDFQLSVVVRHTAETQSWLDGDDESKSPVCHYLRGILAGYLACWCNLPMQCIERQCSAQGDAHCSFFIAPVGRIERYLSPDEKKELRDNAWLAPVFARYEGELQNLERLQHVETLLGTVHHRVKSNLQLIVSLFNLQANFTSDPVVQRQLRNAIDRVKTMSLAHDKLQLEGRHEVVNLSDYLRGVVQATCDSYGVYSSGIRVEADFDSNLDYVLLENATPIGLIVNELLSNAFRHAFGDEYPGATVTITGKRMPEQTIQLVVKDNGRGLREPIAEPDERSGFGIDLLDMLCEQLSGKLEFREKDGLEVRITLSPDEGNRYRT